MKDVSNKTKQHQEQGDSTLLSYTYLCLIQISLYVITIEKWRMSNEQNDEKSDGLWALDSDRKVHPQSSEKYLWSLDITLVLTVLMNSLRGNNSLAYELRNMACFTMTEDFLKSQKGKRIKILINCLLMLHTFLYLWTTTRFFYAVCTDYLQRSKQWPHHPEPAKREDSRVQLLWRRLPSKKRKYRIRFQINENTTSKISCLYSLVRMLPNGKLTTSSRKNYWVGINCKFNWFNNGIEQCACCDISNSVLYTTKLKLFQSTK